jgi:hypothetical protein
VTSHRLAVLGTPQPMKSVLFFTISLLYLVYVKEVDIATNLIRRSPPKTKQIRLISGFGKPLPRISASFRKDFAKVLVGNEISYRNSIEIFDN